MKIFIVDDEEVSIFIIKNMLVLEGGIARENISSFLSATEAFQALIATPQEALPDLILLDLAMPTVDGWEFLEMLAPYRSGFGQKCNIHILTSSILQADEAKARRNPMVKGFLHKPISGTDIKNLITHGSSFTHLEESRLQ